MNNALIASFWESGWFGRAILIILFMLSIYAWAVIALKWRMMKEIDRKSNEFLALFENSQGDVFSLFQRGVLRSSSPFQTVYQTICRELYTILQNSKNKCITPLQLSTLSEMADRMVSKQLIAMEKYLIVLATTASVSPLLGLLGTVWGVLISFRGMSVLGSASLAVVAPGISEALVTTVTGLIVAIPALVGYNWITNRLQVLSIELENFSSRLVSYIQASYTTSSPYEKEPAY